MFQVSQSATGQFVVTHPASNTVMVGDELVATYEQMRTFVAGLGDAARAHPAPTHSRLGSAAAHWLVLAALALLPFVWLGALHVSLGRLVAELSLAAPAGSKEQPGADLRARVERVERQIETLAHPPKRTPEPVAEPLAEPLTEQAEQQAERANDRADEPAGPEKAAAGAGAGADAPGVDARVGLPRKAAAKKAAAKKAAEDAGSGPR